MAVIIQFVTISQTNKTLKHQAKEAEAERILRTKEAVESRLENQRIEWKNYLVQLMEKMISAHTEYEQFLGTEKKDPERHARIVGLAIAICLAANDEEMTRYADDELTPYFKDKSQSDGTIIDWASRNRNAMHFAVHRLAAIIKLT